MRIGGWEGGGAGVFIKKFEDTTCPLILLDSW